VDIAHDASMVWLAPFVVVYSVVGLIGLFALALFRTAARTHADEDQPVAH
jgi:hypothetical protein